MNDSAKYKVILPAGKRPGIVRCGAFEPGNEYAVSASEALRLVETKGFEFVDAGDAAKAQAEVKAAIEAELAAREASAPAATEVGDEAAHKQRKNKAAPAADDAASAAKEN